MTQLKLMNSLWIEWRKQGIVKEYIFISDDFHLHDNDKKLCNLQYLFQIKMLRQVCAILDEIWLNTVTGMIFYFQVNYGKKEAKVV